MVEMSFMSAFDNVFGDGHLLDSSDSNFDHHGGIGDWDMHGGVGHDAHAVALWNGHGDTPAFIDNFGGVHDLYHDYSSNIDDILGYDDPLAHAHDYHSHHLMLDDTTNNHLVHVNEYVKSDGTVVNCHIRTAPDGILENNLSYNK